MLLMHIILKYGVQKERAPSISGKNQAPFPFSSGFKSLPNPESKYLVAYHCDTENSYTVLNPSV